MVVDVELYVDLNCGVACVKSTPLKEKGERNWSPQRNAIRRQTGVRRCVRTPIQLEESGDHYCASILLRTTFSNLAALQFPERIDQDGFSRMRKDFKNLLQSTFRFLVTTKVIAYARKIIRSAGEFKLLFGSDVSL